MTTIRALLAIVLAAFLALTARALLAHGYLGFLERATANSAVGLLSLCLVLTLSAIALWMWRDARRLSIAPWPYLLTGASLGVAGPLLYLLRRPGRIPIEETVTPRQLLVSELVIALSILSALTLGLHGRGSLAAVTGANESTELLAVDLAISWSLLVMGTIRAARALRAGFHPLRAR